MESVCLHMGSLSPNASMLSPFRVGRVEVGPKNYFKRRAENYFNYFLFYLKPGLLLEASHFEVGKAKLVLTFHFINE